MLFILGFYGSLFIFSQDPVYVAEDEATLKLVQETLENLPLYYCLSRDISRSFYSKSENNSNLSEPALAAELSSSDEPHVHASSAAASAPESAAHSVSETVASLWRSVDPIYTWNFHMCRGIIEAGDFIARVFKSETTSSSICVRVCTHKIITHVSQHFFRS